MKSGHIYRLWIQAIFTLYQAPLNQKHSHPNLPDLFVLRLLTSFKYGKKRLPASSDWVTSQITCYNKNSHFIPTTMYSTAFFSSFLHFARHLSICVDKCPFSTNFARTGCSPPIQMLWPRSLLKQWSITADPQQHELCLANSSELKVVSSNLCIRFPWSNWFISNLFVNWILCEAIDNCKWYDKSTEQSQWTGAAHKPINKQWVQVLFNPTGKKCKVA